jgi:chemotaxis protein CheY-P-specific phosphatase CheC
MQFANMLNEICKVSMIKATTALSRFLQTPLGVDIKPVEIKQLDDINIFNDVTENTVNIFLPITGNLTGVSFFRYTKQSALSLCDILFHRTDGSTKTFSEPEISALSEVANIVMGNFLTPFAQSLQMESLMHRSAVFDCGSFDTAVTSKMQKFTDKTDEALLNISFDFQQASIQGYVLIIFDEEKINTMLNKVC